MEPQRTEEELQNRLNHVRRIQSSLGEKLSSLLAISGVGSRGTSAFGLLETIEATMLSIMGNFGSMAGAVLHIRDKPRRAVVVSNLGFVDELVKGAVDAFAHDSDLGGLSKPMRVHELSSVGFTDRSCAILDEMQVSLVIPMQVQKDEFGIIVLGPRLRRQEFAPDDLELITVIVMCMTLAVRTIRLGEKNMELQAEKFRIRGILEEFVSPEIVEELLSDRRTHARTERKRVTIAMADIRDFTAISERTEAEVLGRCLNQFYSAMSDAVMQQGGVVDKFIGDAVMAVFGGPGSDTRFEERAVASGIVMVKAFDRLVRTSEEFRRVFGEVGIGVGICTGDALVGSLGSGKRLDYTVVGRTVNLASRLSSLARASEVLIDGTTYACVRDEYAFEMLAPTSVRGIGDLVQMYKLIPP